MVTGERVARPNDKATYYRQERFSGEFRRAVTLPDADVQSTPRWPPRCPWGRVVAVTVFHPQRFSLSSGLISVSRGFQCTA